MKTILKWILVAFAIVIAAGVIIPMFAGNTRTGSKRYALKWRKQLEACNSVNDVNELYISYRVYKTPEGHTQFSTDVTKIEDCPLALIQVFDSGDWVVCVHTPTHGPRSGPGAGTAVTKDSKGKMTAYLGHICDCIWISGDDLEDFYSRLRKEYRFEKVIDYH
jgi:hypothetical protein